MSFKTFIVVAAATVVLSGCGFFGGGAPSKGDVQAAVQRLAKEEPMLFGSDTPVIKDAKCTKTGNDTYDCVTSLALSSAPDEAHTVTVKMTKLSGQWTAQIPNILQ